MQTSQTILERLITLYPQAKKSTLRDMVAGKRVRINGTAAKSLKQPVTTDDRFEVTDVPAAPAKPTILARGLQLLHMDADLLIVDKPEGLLTATDAAERRPTVLKILTDYFRKQNSKNQVLLIHRLDRDASGLLVLARNADSYHALKQQFFEHTITRRYDALVHGIPAKKQDRLENFLVEDPATGKVSVTTDIRKGKLAILDYLTIQTDKKQKFAHLQCTLFTGRKHQIRVQLKTLGHAVLGDRVYGQPGAGTEPPARLALHASHLTFKHPRTRRETSFDSQMPGSFAHLMRT